MVIMADPTRADKISYSVGTVEPKRISAFHLWMAGSLE
jgi:hypothetical protein